MGKQELTREIISAEKILFVGHVSPDGDSIGCQLAMAEGLEQLGKSVSIQSHDPVPRSMTSFDVHNRIEVVETLKGSFDLIVFVECPNADRCGFSEFPEARTAGLDHHPDYQLNADVNWVDASSASTAELVFQLLEELNITITKSMADALYLGIVTDTGRFVYPNTKPETLEVAAKLIRKGADPNDIFLRIYLSFPVARLDLKKELLASMERYFDNNLAVMVIRKETIAENEFTDELFDDLVNMPLEAEEVLISLMVRQTEDDIWRFNLRSKGNNDVGSIAAANGGGGHRNAAGFRSTEALESIMQKVLCSIEEII